MKSNEFIKNCKTMGYCDIKLAIEYCDKNAKENYSEEDYVAIFRIHENRLYLKRDNVHYLRSVVNQGKTSKRYYGDGGEEGNR
jgi:hypothetical protein